ncbi:glycosyltransferase [Salinisphaera sp. T31B1]
MPERLTVFTSSLNGGGVQRSMRNLATALTRDGFAVDLVVCHGHDVLAAELRRAGVNVVELARSAPLIGRALALRADPTALRPLGPTVLWPLKTWSKIAYLAALRDHLAATRPIGLLSAMTQCNLVALWAHRLAGIDGRVVVSERNMLSNFVARHAAKSRWRHLPALVAHSYPAADAIVGVSQAVADDLSECTGLARASITTAPNPVVDDALRDAATRRSDHPWFAADEPPVVLGVGRLLDQKDPATLMHAFARVRSTRPLRLMLIGDGPLRTAMMRLADTLGLADDVMLPGWDDHPFPAMAGAAVFVLPSKWEGLPGVLIQALACGCPVVATDCPGGSAEILDHGAYGRLVPVADVDAMAEAITATLDDPPDRARLKARAEDYSAERSARRYAELMTGTEPT